MIDYINELRNDCYFHSQESNGFTWAFYSIVTFFLSFVLCDF